MRAAAPVDPDKKPAYIRWIWALPILAILVSLALIIQTIRETGPTIVIAFKTAEGLTVGDSKVRYKSIVVGTVSKISLSPDRKSALVSVDAAPGAYKIDRETARFWLVKPQIDKTGVAGLKTLVSGTYIEVDFEALSSEKLNVPAGWSSDGTFIALDAPPTRMSTREGTYVTVHAANLGRINVLTPVYFMKVKVYCHIPRRYTV